MTRVLPPDTVIPSITAEDIIPGQAHCAQDVEAIVEGQHFLDAYGVCHVSQTWEQAFEAAYARPCFEANNEVWTRHLVYRIKPRVGMTDLAFRFLVVGGSNGGYVRCKCVDIASYVDLTVVAGLQTITGGLTIDRGGLWSTIEIWLFLAAGNTLGLRLDSCSISDADLSAV
jgi:hypothetical protein